ncbi:MAG TPA: dipeptidase [Candidatus Acidoferrum sp.]
MFRTPLLLAFCLFGLALMPKSTRAQSVSDKAKKLHSSSIVIDTHDDTTQRLLDPSFDIGTRHADGNIDIPRMREGGLNAIFFSIWIPSKTVGPEAVKKSIDQIDAVREAVRKHPNDLLLATTADDIRVAKKQNKIAALMGVEGGHMIDNDLAVLRSYAVLGVRYMTLTHMGNTDWADSSTDTPAHNGLTDFGKQVVLEMNRLGVMVDISHVSDKTFYDAIATSKAPVIASHSSARALTETPRNMTDDMMRALAKNGGVIQINYHVGFLSQEFRDFEKAHPEAEKEINDEVKKRCGDNEACSMVMGDQVVRDMMQAGMLPKVDWTKIIDHIDYAVKVAGIDHVGLGSDFDGAVMPMGMQDVSHLPQITGALLQKGYSESDIRKILGENTLRVMSEVERVSRQLNSSAK